MLNLGGSFEHKVQMTGDILDWGSFRTFTPVLAVKWFQSYFEQRNNQVCVGDSLSRRRPVTSGVPQGSVLGARQFTKYSYPLALIFHKYKVEYHSYADDSHVYLHCDNDVASLRHAVHQLENCIFDICDWMSRNALKLNEHKT